MKYFTFLFIVLSSFVNSFSLYGQLSSTAELFREDYPDGYSLIRDNAINEWHHDSVMIVYTINRESQSFLEIMNNLEIAIDEPNIFLYTVILNSCIEWGNGVDFEHFDAAIRSEDIFKSMFELDCKWSMVLYSINKKMATVDY